MQKVKINLFGIGCHIVKGQFDEMEWEKFDVAAKKLGSPLKEAFFDTSFFENETISEYNSWHNLGNIFKTSGLLNDYKSHIEIRINGRQKRKILFQELSNEDFLFPLYQTTFTEISNEKSSQKSCILVEKEIGTIASYQFETDIFLLDNLIFTLQNVALTKDLQFQILSQIEYKGKKLVSKKSDSLVNERFALIDSYD